MSDAQSSVWGHPVHLAIFPMLRYFKRLLLPVSSIQPNFMESMVISREHGLLLFLTICQIKKILWHFEIFVKTGLYWKFQDATPTVCNAKVLKCAIS